MRGAWRVAQSLATRLPNVRFDWLEGAGHMAPITEAARVNEVILKSLGALQRTPVA